MQSCSISFACILLPLKTSLRGIKSVCSQHNATRSAGILCHLKKPIKANGALAHNVRNDAISLLPKRVYTLQKVATPAHNAAALQIVCRTDKPDRNSSLISRISWFTLICITLFAPSLHKSQQLMRHVVGTFYNGAERRQVQKQHDRLRHRAQKAQHPAYLCHHSIIRYRAK